MSSVGVELYKSRNEIMEGSNSICLGNKVYRAQQGEIEKRRAERKHLNTRKNREKVKRDTYKWYAEKQAEQVLLKARGTERKKKSKEDL